LCSGGYSLEEASFWNRSRRTFLGNIPAIKGKVREREEGRPDANYLDHEGDILHLG
jgi:hypothetical protein